MLMLLVTLVPLKGAAFTLLNVGPLQTARSYWLLLHGGYGDGCSDKKRPRLRQGHGTPTCDLVSTPDGLLTT